MRDLLIAVGDRMVYLDLSCNKRILFASLFCYYFVSFLFIALVVEVERESVPRVSLVGDPKSARLQGSDGW